MGVCTVLSYMELLVLLQSSSPTNPKMCEMQVVTCEKSMQGSSFLLYLSKFSRFYMTAVVVHRFAFLVKRKTLQSKKCNEFYSANSLGGWEDQTLTKNVLKAWLL